MKNYQFQNLFRLIIGILLCVLFSTRIVLGQFAKITPPGGSAFFSTRVTLLAARELDGLASLHPTFVSVVYRDSADSGERARDWRPPEGRGPIVGASGIETAGVRFLKVLLKDLTVVVLDYRRATNSIPPVATEFPPITPKGGYGESWVALAGDATYVLSTSFVYVYRDSVSSWKVDTTGLGGATITGISLDTSQYVYAATTNGVFKQHPDSSVWHQITNLSTTNFASILVDRRNRIFAANYVNYNGKGTYISTNGGSSWTLDSAGIGTRQIQRLSDDAYGNTYAIANGSGEVYRRKNNTPGWMHIEGGINAITVNPVTINSVSGDSVLYAATNFGLFASTDQGTTWTEDNANNPATSFYSFAKGAGGKWFTSTDLAMYSLGPTDTAWTKAFPTSGYGGSLAIYTDGIGNIYTSVSTSTGLAVYKSSNNGSTWNVDSVTLNQFSTSVFFIDEQGGQHTSDKSGPRTRPYGGSWGGDTTGFLVTNSSSNYSAALASDHHGYLYLSGKYFNGSAHVNGQVMRRPINGGTWLVDTVGLYNFSYLDALYPGKNGEMYGTYRPNLVHRSNNGKWSTLNLPSVGVASLTNMVVSVDSSGAIFVALRGSRGSVSYGGLGVFFSTDTGTTWKYAGLDSIFVNQLVSYGDSTYAATNDGLYILTRKVAGATAVHQIQSTPTTYVLYQNYPNPFNPSTTIKFSLGQRGRVSLKIFDILGREVATLVNGELEAGLHQATFDATRFASGIYFYRVKAGEYTATKKLILLK